MQIELTGQAQEVVEKLLASGDFSTADEAVAFALRIYSDASPTPESLKAKLQEGLDDAQAGRVAPLDIEDVKRRGRERLTARHSADADV